MFPVCGLLMLMCLHCGRLCSAIYVMQILSLTVDYGHPAVLQCNGSAFKDMEGSVHWELNGRDLVVLQGKAKELEPYFKDRVHLPSDEQQREGNWSMVLSPTRLRDSEEYECIWNDEKVLSRVSLKVSEPPLIRNIIAEEGIEVTLRCYLKHPRSYYNDVMVQWTMDGKNILDSNHVVFEVNDEESYIVFNATMSDSGTYQCWSNSVDFHDLILGIPDNIKLTVLRIDPDYDMDSDRTTRESSYWTEAIHTTPDFLEGSSWQMEDVDTQTPITEDWAGTTLTTSWTQQVTTVSTTDSPPDFLPPQPEEPTQLIEVTEYQPEETPEVKVTSAPYEGDQLETFPWIRIGLIGGVLILTSVVMCVLGALRQI